MSTVAVIGANGQLGQYLQESLQTVLAKSGEAWQLIPLARDRLDLSQPEKIADVLRSHRPDLIINASAYTAVDKAESEPELAHVINCEAPKQMAVFCADNDVPFMHYSTDYVFSGDASQPYAEDQATNPQGVYGKSKLGGELAILETAASAYIFRTSWVYSQRGNNFYKTMLRLGADRDSLSIVADQIGAPTYAGSIAAASAEIAMKILAGDKFANGVYHMTCGGQTSWYEFAKSIFELNDVRSLSLAPLTTAEYPTPAKRPAFSVLDNQKLHDEFQVSLPSWLDALQECVDEASV